MSTLSAQHRLEQRLRGIARPQIHPKEGSGPWPLSFSQQRMWLLQRVDPNSGYYNMVRVLRLEGTLDIGALEQALAEIVRRHAALRTTIQIHNGSPIQVVRPFRNLSLNTEEPADDEDCRTRIQAFSARPFKLDSELPFRYTLYRVGQSVSCLALVFHHVAVDGWTLNLLLAELGRLYSSFATKRFREEPEPALDYLDFTAWQRTLFAPETVSDKIQAQYDFWSQQLHGVPGMLALPLDRLRPARPSHAGASEKITLPAATVASLREFAKSKRNTVFAVLLAGLEVLLSRYSRQNDFVVGTPVTGRTLPELETLIGCVTNTLFLRSSLDGDPSFSELIVRVSMVVNDAVANQDIPFELLMERLQTPPRLQVLFAQQFPAEGEIEMEGLQCSVDRPSRLTSRCDLTIFTTDRGSTIDMEVEYDTDLFEAETIRRFLTHYRVLLDSAVSQPEARVSQIPMLASEECGLLEQFNQTTRPYPSEPVHILFERQATATPDSVAIVDDARQLTYAQLNASANRVANYLRSQDLQPGDLVAVSLPRTAHFPAAVLGIWKAGAAWVPLDPDEPRIRSRKVLVNAGAKLLLADTTAPWSDLRMPTLTLADALAHSNASNPPACGGADDLAYVMYTSGSTGQPKGVEVAHRGIVRLVSNTDYVHFGAQETFLAAAPVTFDASTFELWGALLHGSKCVIYPGRVPEPHELQRLIQREGITTLWLTASLFNTIVDVEPQCLRGIRQLLVGGEALSVPHVRRAIAALPETRLINGYGPTENTTFTCCWPIPSALPGRPVSIPIGAPIANTRVYILDDQRELCGIDVPGEIYIGGDGLALGYRNSPELTAERFVSAPWGERLYRSGDLGRWRRDGTIEFLGRTDSQVKIRGFRIEPGEIEAAITDYPGIEDAFVLAVEDRNGERRLAAYIKPRAREQMTEAQIRTYLLDRLPAVLLPSWYCFVDGIPRTANGKRDATALPPPESYPRPEARAAHGDTEHRVMEIVHTLLPDVTVGADTNLFDAGMHSLLAARLVANVGRVFEQPLLLSALYANPTVEGIASFIDAGSQSKDPDAPVPFFFAHAGPMFRHLAARMDDRPFYGIGYSLTGPPPPTIEEHARYEADTIEKTQPQGPVLIGGWSASGVLAVEIARQLTQRGRIVGLVVLFDAPNYSYFRSSPLARRVTRSVMSVYRNIRHHARVLVSRPAAERAPYLRERIGALGWVSQQIITEVQYKRNPDRAGEMDEDRVFIAIARNHVPAPYAGRALLLRRRERASEWGESWELGWKGVVSDLEIQTIGGDHMSIFEEAHVDGMAELLRQRFEEVTRVPANSAI